MDTAGSVSLWTATSTNPAHPPLDGDAAADICVIGAGIAGVSTAYLLAREGKSVILIDAQQVGAGETGRTTAHLFPPDEWYGQIERDFGAQAARLVAGGVGHSIALVETIIAREQIDCEFEHLDGYLYSPGAQAEDEIRHEFEAARKAGAEVERLERVPGLSFDTGPCLRFAKLAQFHPLKYLQGLCAAIERDGGRIHGHTRALELKKDGASHLVLTERGTVRANAVVVATNTPFNDRVVMHTKQAGYRTYVIGVRVPKGSVPRILLWDTGDPYYYVRLETPDPAASHEILVVGGQDHKTGQDKHPEHRYAEIEDWVRARYPMAEAVQYRWSGEVMEPSDGLPYLGRNPLDSSDVFIITGDSGNGMTHCTLGAAIVSDLVMGRDNPYAELYAPSRKPVHALRDFVQEQANTLGQYGDWLKGGEARSVQDIPAGEAAIVNHGMHKIAVYRDEQGGVHAVSAACTHLGCVVNWNSAEKSWDCPCHASRFAIDGSVLHGPAPRPLKQEQL
jgi:glycine/D-amino acid oxidase-like deaminating enzyme/nitrite reductase/ring-hydroxylating ferredoxin subunit